MNKEKLLELAKIPLNENCSAMFLKKLPEKLGDPGKFLIPSFSAGTYTNSDDFRVSGPIDFSAGTYTKENDDLFDLECKTNDWKRILYDAPIDEAECFDPGGNNDEIDAFLAIEVPTYSEGYFDSEGDVLYLA
ncbi:hypothetical protein Tco_0135680 [Tanacetum coccineum]